jgi:hypothetical protein
MANNKENGLNKGLTGFDNVFEEINLDELQDIQSTTNSSEKGLLQSKKAIVLFIYLGLELLASVVPAINSSLENLRPVIMLYLSTQAGIDISSILKKK